MRRSIIPVVAIAFVLGGALGTVGLFAGNVLKPDRVAASRPDPAWTEVAWPFAIDQWGTGKAFRCPADQCGAEVNLYLRAKIGFCNCVSAIDDEELERVGDVDLVGAARAAQGPGRPIDVRWMKGRSRGYAVGGRGAAARSVLAVAFHDRCDLIVATAAIGADQSAAQQDAVLEFLNGDRVLRWAEVTLGL